MPIDHDPDLVFEEDRTYIEIMLDHMVRDAAYPDTALNDSKKYVVINRKELARKMVIYCSRLRQRAANEAQAKSTSLDDFSTNEGDEVAHPPTQPVVDPHITEAFRALGPWIA